MATGTGIHSRAWTPVDHAKAAVIIVHGLGDHSGRFEHVGHYLMQQRYATYALDYCGHGQSRGQRVYVEYVEEPSQDLESFAAEVRQRYPDKKLFIYAHSMGSLVALRYVLGHQDQLAGLIVTGTPLHLARMVPGPVDPLVNFLSRRLPNLPMIPSLGTDILCKDTDVVAAYNSDPLVYHGWLKARIVHYLLMESRYLSSQLENLHLPLLILHGADDRLCAPQGSRTLHEHTASSDKTLKIYPNLRHEIHNEPEQDRVLADVVAWLDAH